MANGEVNIEIYKLLDKCETGLCIEQGKVIAYVHIPFCKLDGFAKILGFNHFDEGGIEVRMFHDTICIELNGIIEAYGHNLSDYKDCFTDWKTYETEILSQEKE
jgi:hypothetical protein